MRLFKNKILWVSIYAVVITGVFLYLLFPSAFVMRQIESATLEAGYALTARALQPSLPLGVKLKDVTVRSAGLSTDASFQGELLDLQVHPAVFFQKIKRFRFQGKAYGGSFDGSTGFISEGPVNGLVEGKIQFQNMDLIRAGSSGIPLFRGMTGTARGSMFYAANDAAAGGAVGKLSLYVSRGVYPLPEPFLGVSRIAFDRGEIQAQLKDGNVTLTRFDIYGAQVNCFLNGSIQLADRVEDSRLNLKGVMELAGKNKIRMNVMVGGTLTNPSFRYI